VKPLIALSAPRIVRCGDFGHETVVKILTNMLCAVQDCAMGEVMMIAKKSGVDLKLLLGFDDATIYDSLCAANLVNACQITQDIAHLYGCRVCR